jgi:hypothetical protein
MTPEFLKAELDRAEEAELQSDEQLRQLANLIDKSCGPNPAMTASDCAKVISTALALNDRLQACTEKLRKQARIAQVKSSRAEREANAQ